MAGGAENWASTAREKCSEIFVVSFGDAAQAPGGTAGSLRWGEPEVAGKVSPGPESAEVADESDDGGSGEKADAGDGPESLDVGVLLGQSLKLMFDGFPLSLELADFAVRVKEVIAENVWKARGCFGTISGDTRERDPV